MQQYSGLSANPDALPAVVTIGVFDGMHSGHQFLLDQLSAHAHSQGLRAVVVTFDPHPDSVVRPNHYAGLLQTPAERLQMMSQHGVDAVHSVAFDTTIQQYSAADFMHAVKQATNATELWAGWDFALGRGREGTHERLSEIGAHLGFSVTSMPRHSHAGQAASASQIRQALHDGDISTANALLGRTYHYDGIVVTGDQRGRTIGFPTANIAIDARLLLPKFGVYATRVSIDGTTYAAVTNIGVRPTFQGTEPRIEAHLIDVSVDVYHRPARIEFVDFIRAEQRFNGIDALIAQINHDKQHASELLA